MLRCRVQANNDTNDGGLIGVEKLLRSRYGLFIFSLISGFAYFILIMLMISKIRYFYLLGVFSFPAITCGAALIIIKNVRALEQVGQFDKIRRLLKLHTILIIFTVVYLIIRLFVK